MTQALENEKRITVDYLARVEGEGALNIVIRDGELREVEFNIFEPPRFFEAFMRGRSYTEAPDITARICGICPVAYQMSSVHAMEDALGATVDGQLRELRRLLYCGEWIESHILHVYMLHAPDFLGYQDAIQIAADHPDAVNMALQLKRVGNEIVSTIGGREIHPINVKVGGFYRVPGKKELRPLREQLNWALEAAQKAVAWTATLPFPDFERDYEFVSLKHSDEYPFNEGRLVSNKGLDIPINEYEDHFVEEHVGRTNALQSHLEGRSYFVGPLARYNNNFDQLSQISKDAAIAAGLGPTCTNPFKSIIVRAVESLEAVHEAIRIIDQYEQPDKPAVDMEVKAGRGCGCTEAPRGTLYHSYELDDNGLIAHAKIVPPTSQNQRIIEDDLREYVRPRIDLPVDELTFQCEQAVRNYDPCISCATHFLKLNIDRG